MRIGSDFSGVGAFEQALIRLGVDYTNVFACDMDKYVRETYIANYGEPDYYPKDVYERDIPEDSLDIYMTSPPCQAFSIAGKKKGEADKRGVLFYNSHEFICKNRPRYFIFENVKGLLSDDDGKTFQRWIDYLAKSVNGNPMIFPHDDSAGYHVYHMVLNTKDYGVPQNRERIFIVGIRDDKDNSFRFPKVQHLSKRLKDILEDGVDEKYSLSEKMIKGFIKHNDHHNEKGTGFIWQPKGEDDIATTLRANAALCPTDNTIKETDTGYINQDTQASQVHSNEKETPTISAGTHGYANGYIVENKKGKEDGLKKPSVVAGRMVGRNPDNPKSRKGGEPTQQQLEINQDPEVTNTITTVQKDNVIQLNNSNESGGNQPYQQNRLYDINGISPCIPANIGGDRMHNVNTVKIRRLTPRECFRLQDFPDTFKMPCSDSQMYRQAGNSITVAVLYNILKNLI